MTELITHDVWTHLTTAATQSRGKADVAVAYFGKGAAKLLPLPQGSRLVVDASEPAVKSGQTHPKDLKKLYDAGVQVYSREGLHAKVFVFDNTAFIGSANASNRSANLLVEAVVSTNHVETVKASRAFVRSLCLNELGPKELVRLQSLYREPRVPGNKSKSRSKASRRTSAVLPRLRLVQLTIGAAPEGSESTEETGRQAAKGRMDQPKRHVIDHFWRLGNCPYKRGDLLLMVTDEGNGRLLISPPGRVVHRQVWRRGARKCTFLYLELRNHRRISLGRLAKQLGYGWKKRLQSNGPLKQDLSARLLATWS
jgi:hypothetical protein